MLKEFQIIASFDDISVPGDVIKFRVPFTGVLKIIDLWTETANVSADCVFNLNVSGSDLYSSGARPKIAQSATHGQKTGLSDSLTFGDEIILQLETMSAGIVAHDLVLQLTIDDGKLPDGDLNIATNSLEKIQTIPFVLPGSFSGKNGYVPKYNEYTGQFELWAIGDTPASPNVLPSGLPYWAVYEAWRETAYSNGDSVGTAHDFGSGSNRDATQATTGQKPIFATGQLNGLPGYVFTHTNSSNLAIPSMAALTETETWHVVQITTPGGDSDTAIHQLGTDSSSNHYPYTDGNNYDNGGSNSRKTWSASGADSRSFHLGAWVNKSAEFTYYYNGTQKYTTGSNTPSLNASPTLGKASSVFCSMILMATYIFSSKLGSTDRTTMKGYINSVFGLTIA